MRGLWCTATLAASLLLASSAGATGFHEVGQDLIPREKTEVDLSGYLRTRGEALYNLDLDRGHPAAPVRTSRAASSGQRTSWPSFAIGFLRYPTSIYS